jgi:hypothetical protein
MRDSVPAVVSRLSCSNRGEPALRGTAHVLPAFSPPCLARHANGTAVARASQDSRKGALSGFAPRTGVPS